MPRIQTNRRKYTVSRERCGRGLCISIQNNTSCCESDANVLYQIWLDNNTHCQRNKARGYCSFGL